jgi:type I restriction enzyme S subunit
MKNGWKTRTLGDVLEVQNGYAFDSKLFNSSKGMPLVRIRSLKAGAETETRFSGVYDKKYLVKAGDLLIGMDGEFGCYEWKGAPALLNQRVCRLQGFASDILPRFLYYGVNSHLKAIEDVTGYATVKHLSSKQILSINFPSPPLPEQHRIINILDAAFEGIATAKANAAKNLQNAVFTSRGKGWVDQTLDQVCIVERGSSPRPIKNYFTTKPDGVNWIKIGDTEEGGKYVYSTAQKITPEGAKQSRFVKEGDFILTNSMSFGRPYIMKTSGYIHDGWFVLRLNISIDADYLYYLLSSRFVQDQFARLASGSVVKNISGDLVKQVVLPIPPLEHQHVIVKKLLEISTETQHLANLCERKLIALDALKESLLQQSFTGNL